MHLLSVRNFHVIEYNMLFMLVGNRIFVKTKVSDYHKCIWLTCGRSLDQDFIKVWSQLVRTTVPVSFKDWRAVPQEKKDELWRRVQDECIVPQSYKDKCLKGMADAMRKYKNKLRTTHLDPYTTHEARLNDRPPGVRPEDWAAFVKHNADPKTIEQRRKNTDVRKKLNIYHTSGRYGYARLEEKLKRQKEEHPHPHPPREIEAHKRKDGSFPSSVSSHVGRIQELLSSQEVGSQDILNDPLTKVFGADTRGRV